jgi:hypothetical protein
MTKGKECFYNFYGYSHLDEIDKKKVDEFAGFMTFFDVGVNMYRYVEKESCYKKQYLYVCTPQKIMFVLNVGIIDFPKYQHDMWLKNSKNIKMFCVEQMPVQTISS